MEITAKPIIATTSLSLLLHAGAFAGLLLVYNQVTVPDGGVGRGVEIELISSALVSDQQEADVPRRSDIKPEEKPGASSQSLVREAAKAFSKNTLTSLNSMQAIVVTDAEEKALTDKNRVEQQREIERLQLNAYEIESIATVTQSTSASQQQHAILELLHRRISDNKEYPYLARRQRREGVATVAFVLHPDGAIENAHLITSSRAAALDRAAIAAVKHIEPFAAAQEYLEHAEEFQVDIEFYLL